MAKMEKQSQVKSRRKLLNPVFHLQTKKEEDSQLSRGMIKIVRRTGELNLSGRNLANVPDKVFNMYDLDKDDLQLDMDFNKEEKESWWNFQPLTYMDLSSNVINEIPSSIKMFEELTVLNLQHNSLTSLPPEIGVLQKLTKLNASHNNIKTLPNEFFKLTELQVLRLSHNCLESLSTDLANLVMLRNLDLSHNNITTLPVGIGFLVRLTEINVSHNSLTELPPDIVNLRVLQKMDVTHNNLKFLPNKMGELRKLQFLYAQHNDIKEIPDFEGCEHVEELFFGNNFLKEIKPQFFENTPQLKILELRDNQIESIPEEIAMLQRLIRLDLTNNELSNLPKALALLPHLQNLQLEGNSMKQIRNDIIKGGTCRILKFLRDRMESVDGDKKNNITPPQNKLTAPNKYQMLSLKALNLAMKDLTAVPDDIFDDANNAQVHAVDLSKNKLSCVPAGLKKVVAHATELNLSTNQLKSLPDYFSGFSKLMYLNLSVNMLSSLPQEMDNLQCLRELVISNNRFSEIPECVYNMQGLEIFLANGNKITEINVHGLAQLKRLATLDLSNNNISYVPPELGNMKQLRALELKGNCFRQPRYAILDQGTDAILSYLRDKIPQ